MMARGACLPAACWRGGPEGGAMEKQHLGAEARKAIAGYLFASPVILGLLIWVIGPIIGVLLISLTDWNVLTAPHWVGILNYVRLFTSDLYFWNTLKVTIYYVVLNVACTTLYSLVVAMLLNQNIRGRGVYRSIFYMPTIVPIVASSALWLWLYNPDFGLFNMILQGLRLPRSLWLSSQTTVVPSIVLMSVWGGAGNTIVIFLAALQGVPRELLEAVEIDGGNWWHRFRAITLPMISPVTFFNVVTGLIASFTIFTQSYVMTQGGPNNASLFYVLLLYREGFQRNNIGGAAALSWVLIIIVSLLSLLIFRTSRRWVYYEGEQR
jgi:multiple sugar transport system permease protein